jgi:hypothetical protein
VSDQLSQLSQVELAAVETYERAHRSQPVVLEKLRYVRSSEPMPGYDALTPEQIAEELAGADAETIRAVRDYERKFQHASRCWMKPRACFRRRGRVLERNGRVKRRRRSCVRATRSEREPRPTHRSNAPHIAGRWP